MKKIIFLFILATLLLGCFNVDVYKCIDYKGDKKCRRYYDGKEVIWE